MLECHKNKLSNLIRLISFVLSTVPLSSVALENDIKASFTQKEKIIEYLASEVIWPPYNSDNIVTLCMLGKFDALQQIQAMNGRLLKNKKKLNVKTIQDIKLNKDECQIIYISKTQEENLEKIIQAFANQPVLLLADKDTFAKQGGSINFFLLNNVIAITINYDSLRASHLKLDIKKFAELTVIPEKKDLEESNR